ncbi:sn-glycerol-3-phosphate ABC transporter permease UgpA [Bartonella krasnovii]|uniref:sn-glycerol-3-phosphate transport system permease protein UgpA n=1 Tax=Bartonella krasnovii TaxID=2267275 RepID=A0A5B9D003_9HYPH|nr:sn-glycerol-3-phosphate ABC transporter permease UgpA [Bartonella krasnovii]QEE11519.1 sn-glycerol-3-phosphate ABC transporter permease UgpA [Bartonella krasnovii]UNF29275.1 sn-glycerol-3-phosphate ABC transporter permease UgpA [Bartonella krasnovii]UNF35632.1 sn-glycerol-3-phosphate ABC transporter permease UgpA [Bartonella krasnovii]UNF37252.1 sn-glycerol-3-phosphate ABC transporter permease UgpA [Bartonella krasnovii]UNF38946.1 sn-glycerol-3-phosphate ABC transporter permease UgpA [Barto
MQEKHAYFKKSLLSYGLLFPQLLVTFLFFFWPAAQAVKSSFEREDPFGFTTTFIGFENYLTVLSDPTYRQSLLTTVVFSISVTVVSMTISLLLAVCVDRVVRAKKAYTMLLLWPYAVAPVLAGILWLFIFHPAIGIIPFLLEKVGVLWNYRINGTQAMILIVIAASWKQISYNFLFFLTGLQSIPHSQIEAAAIDGAGPFKRFWTVVFPQISPTTFFLLIININYVMFDTFGIIDNTTSGGPARATNILVYKIYDDGFKNQIIGTSAAQSTILMLMVIVLTFIQFRWIERRVQY